MFWRRWLPAIGIVVTVAVLATLALIWPGLDTETVRRPSASVWILQTGTDQRYARVNTALAELDTVRQAKDPSRVFQSGEQAYLVADGMGRIAPINAGTPTNLDAEALAEATATPAGTEQVAQAGPYVAFRSNTGTVSYGRLDTVAALTQLRAADAPEVAFTAATICVNENGLLTAYSAVSSEILQYDISTGTQQSLTAVRSGPTDPGSQVTSVGDHWMLVGADGRTWVSGRSDPVSLASVGTVAVQRPSITGTGFAVADVQGLFTLDFEANVTPTHRPGSALGVPATPIELGGDLVAAWLPREGEGTLWSHGKSTSLDYAGHKLADDAVPQLMVTADRVVLNETRSGWAWTLPDGALVPSSQDWQLAVQDQQQSSDTGERAETVREPKPPVAVNDQFGVRAGALVNLPVLLNDYDANTDILTIDGKQLGHLDPDFGTVELTDNNQRLAVRVASGATGSASFTYRDSDGTSAQGRYSNTATVRLTVQTGNKAPQCDDACRAQWPTPEVAPGGTIRVPVLNGWVDPEGDQVLLSNASTPNPAVRVAVNPEGDVVVQHRDADATADQRVPITLTVSDINGDTATKTLVVRVTRRPALVAESFAVTRQAGAPTTIDLSRHLLGTMDQLSIAEVRPLGGETVSFAATAFTFESDKVGTHFVEYVVTDGQSKATGQVRITVTSGEPSLSTGAVVAFVRPNEDATVDVLNAVDNPTGRVLLLSGAQPQAVAGGEMAVDVVGQQYLRVSGTTADDTPGKIGVINYSVADGQGGEARGQAAVYLLPEAQQVAPIAVADAVTVRAGTQLDIPVTKNDIAPVGGQLRLDPRAVYASDPNMLAFASGNLVRTLAPAKPGVYRINYGCYVAGNPRLVAEATLVVTVLPAGANQPPVPVTLTGRVLSGQTVAIGFDDYGIDPDGDAVRLDQVITQPKSGSAAVSGDGKSISYTSVAGFSGQVEFSYRVVDSEGAVGVGMVRIGVLDQAINPAPITYTDYAEVQVGRGNQIRVSALANDIDPNGGVLTITEVKPNTREFAEDGTANPEYQRLADLIDQTTDTEVVVDAGNQTGTTSYRYRVKSDSGNTADGLIVIRVVDTEVPNYPVVADTVLTAETREQFPVGVDVVTDKATWPGGESGRLRLNLWQGDSGASSDGVAVSGWALSGALSEHTRIIPFEVTATAADGSPLTTGDGATIATFAFLRIPGTSDLPLSLRSDLTAQVVAEKESVSFDLNDLVARPTASVLEVGTDGLAASGARSEGSCVLVSGTVLEYRAGRGAPWDDSCIVPVRLAGQDAYTYLAVPIRVTPEVPQPILTPASVTVSPGETATYDLATMTTWAGVADQAAVHYAINAATGDFAVTMTDQRLTIIGNDDAVVGRDDRVTVSITSHEAVVPAVLTIRVGPAPALQPSGASYNKVCSQNEGDSCEITVIGGAGEVNPLPRSPLRVVSVTGGSECPGMTFSKASDSSVRATWASSVSGRCSASVVLADKQNRVTAGERNATVTVDLQSYPLTPSSVYQSGYTADSVQLRVRPGEARSSYPEVTDYVVRQAGKVVAHCDAAGVCESISAPLGEIRSYEVTSHNAVGESASSISVQAWAYLAPNAPKQVSATPVVTSDGSGGVVSLTVSGIDTTRTGSLRITTSSGVKQTVDPHGSDTVVVDRLEVPNHATSITVTPVSAWDVPPDLEGSTAGEAVTITASGIGKPTGLSLTLTSSESSGATAVITAKGAAATNGEGSSLRYGFAQAAKSCTPTETSTTAQFSVPAGETYTFTLCVASLFNGVNYGTTSITEQVNAVQVPEAPTGYIYTVNSKVQGTDTHPKWLVTATPVSSEQPPNNMVAKFDKPDGFGTNFADNYRVRYCHTSWTDVCGDWGAVRADPGGAPYPVQASIGVTACTPGSELQLADATTMDRGNVTYSLDKVEYEVDGSWVTPTDSLVPEGATGYRNVGVTVSWPMSWNLDSHVIKPQQGLSGSCG